MQTDEAELQDTKQQHVDLEDVTHIITMTMDYRDHEAVEARNAEVAAAAEANGKQTGTAPGATGRRGDLIAVVTVSCTYYYKSSYVTVADVFCVTLTPFW